MIRQLEIENFKSVKHLNVDVRRINIFIGEPNTGKSNILESVGIFSSSSYGNLRDFVRFERPSNLFYDENLEDIIKVRVDNQVLEIKFDSSLFKGACHEEGKEIFSFQYDLEGRYQRKSLLESPFKFYRFVRNEFPSRRPGFLLPPFGENLPVVLMTSKQLKSTISQIFIPFGLKLAFKPQENKIEVYKQQDDIIITYPYSLISETLQRIVFYHTAIKSNRDSILIFEEPESHAFPYYTKFLAETVAKDKSNQYFISTHNPYFLLSVLEKSPKDDIKIFVTHLEDYQTKVKPLSEEDLREVMDLGIDLFFNLERFREGKE